jgi:hypothetical protein
MFFGRRLGSTFAPRTRTLLAVAVVFGSVSLSASLAEGKRPTSGKSDVCKQIGFLSLESVERERTGKGRRSGPRIARLAHLEPIFGGAGCSANRDNNAPDSLTPTIAQPVQTVPGYDSAPITSNVLGLVDNLIQAERNTDEKVANLIQLMIYGVLGLTSLIGLGVLWLVRVLRDFMKQWAKEHMKDSFMEIQSMTSDANADFVSALEMFSSHQLETKIEQFRQAVQNGSAPNLDNILEAVVELAVYPVRLRDDIQAIAYRQEPLARQLQRVYSLWAEVKSEAVDVRTARRLVTALIPLVEAKPDSARVVKALVAFAKQLSTVAAGTMSLPEEPGF